MAQAAGQVSKIEPPLLNWDLGYLLLLDLKVLLTLLAMIFKQTCQIILSLPITTCVTRDQTPDIYSAPASGLIIIQWTPFELNRFLEILFQQLHGLGSGFLKSYFVNHSQSVSAINPGRFLWPLFFENFYSKNPSYVQDSVGLRQIIRKYCVFEVWSLKKHNSPLCSTSGDILTSIQKGCRIAANTLGPWRW